MHEGGHDDGVGEAVEVAAGLAEPRAAQADVAYPELAPDQVIERHPGRGDVAAALRRGDLDRTFGGQRVKRFRLDEGDFAAARARLVRVVARAEEVPVAFEAAPGDRARLGHRLHGLPGRPRDVDRDHGSLPHGRHARRGAGLKQVSRDATLAPPCSTRRQVKRRSRGVCAFDLKGRVAVVTGGNGGIGLGMARGLAEAGAALVVAARNRDKSARAVAELKALGADAESVTVDVTEEASVEAMVKETMT